jgi:dihydroorotase
MVLMEGCVRLPGFLDVHVHLREPGFSYKETIATGTTAAAAGGFVAVCAMPNLSPVPDSLPHLREELTAIERGARVKVVPYGAITVGEKGEVLSDMEGITPYVCAFSDDGHGVQREDIMRAAMEKAKTLGKLICAHCEDESAGDARESEWRHVERDLRLAQETGCKYHVCHVSTRESVSLIREAKKDGVDVSCETCPQYILLTDADRADSGRYRMNPPLQDEGDSRAIIEGLADGTIDIIATDHAPHSAEEKGRGFQKSVNGIVGLETAFPLLYTHLVREGVLPLERLVHLIHGAPCARFGIVLPEEENYTVFDLSAEYDISPATFLSMGKSTPFEGMRVFGRCVRTVANGIQVFGA